MTIRWPDPDAPRAEVAAFVATNAPSPGPPLEREMPRLNGIAAALNAGRLPMAEPAKRSPAQRATAGEKE